MDPIEALIALRNGLSHGTAEIHSPGMALAVVEACARAIDDVYPVWPSRNLGAKSDAKKVQTFQ
jgi:hypothetical protein